MTRELTTIGFRGAELSAFGGDTPDTTMVAVKPMVEGMGLDWKRSTGKSWLIRC